MTITLPPCILSLIERAAAEDKPDRANRWRLYEKRKREIQAEVSNDFHVVLALREYLAKVKL